ncbi:hypothetical protein QBC46DRAFT_410349 [Diplogelasinospora grovesii]|uniref:Uncharacterized protein n=1 Tax=Diplogelasinospora grovesii TaxID=303347 RepID=A0AAN6S2Q0_9PEZI|nr:hypothetical protein QBC46DRAFT_410349 [Diplogelasinospora grovesii]
MGAICDRMYKGDKAVSAAVICQGLGDEMPSRKRLLVSGLQRSTVYPGKAPLKEILAGKVTERNAGSKTVVTISATSEVRDKLTTLTREYLRDNIDLKHIEYQP